jgi:hypothetical protein
LDVALGSASWVTERSFAALSLGFQENGLISSQSIWDRDLRFLGAGVVAGVRDVEGLLQEASVRAVVGRVRNILGGDLELAAGQVVLKLDTGAWSWTGYAGRWHLEWDAGVERLRRLPGNAATGRQRTLVDAGGASGKWNAVLPWELRWFGSRNSKTKETSAEWQLTAGSRERVHWPQASFTWQRLSSTGTLYPVNGDEWWFYRRARGPRFDLSLPLSSHWVATLVYLRQRAEGADYLVTRKILSLTKRF